MNKKIVMILLASGIGGSGLVHEIHAWSKSSQNQWFRKATANLIADFKALEDYSPGELGALIRQVEWISGGISVTGDDLTAAEDLHDSLSGTLGADIRGDNGSTAQEEAIKKVRASIFDLETRAFADAERELTESVDNFAACVNRGGPATTLVRKLWLTEGWLENINDRFKTNFEAKDADKIIASIKDLPRVIKHMGRDPVLEQRFLRAFGIDPDKSFPQTSPELGTFQSRADLYHTIAELLDEAQDDTDGVLWGLEKKAYLIFNILLIFGILNALNTPWTRWAWDIKKLPKKLKNRKNKPKLEATKKCVEPIKETAAHLLADIIKIDEERDRLLGTLDDDYNHALTEETSVQSEIASKKAELTRLRTDKIRLAGELATLSQSETATKTAELIALEWEEKRLAQELADLKKRTLWSFFFKTVWTAGEIAAKEIEVKNNRRKIEQATAANNSPGATTAKAAKEIEVAHNNQEIEDVTKEIAALTARLPQIASDKRAGAIKMREYEAAVRTIHETRAEVEHFIHELDTLIQDLKDGADPKVTTATMIEDPKKAEKELKKMQEELAHIQHRNPLQDSLTALEHIKRKLDVHTPPPVTLPSPNPGGTPPPTSHH